jgi:ribosome biogenesis GTPase
MQKEQQDYLKEQLSTLDTNERLKLYKRASTIRKQQQVRRKPLEDEAPRRTKSLDDFVLQLLLQEAREETTGPTCGHGLVTWLGPKSCHVRSNGETFQCSIPRSISIAVGDRVTFGARGEGHGITSVQPRETVLSRPDVDNGYVERVIAANVDMVVVVVSVIAPPLHPRIIDRYMVAIQKGGAKMLLAINKVDLLDDFNRDDELGKLEPYREVASMIQCSTTSGTGIVELRNMLAGQTCVFVGHSGVGKSSLVNCFDPSLGILTRSVSEGYGRGTHTTTSSTMHELQGGTKIIDTPGIRSFGLWDIGKEDLGWYFPEFDEFRSDCKFSDCTHSHEPSCGVKRALAKGMISQARYDAYVRILTFN